MDSLVQFLYTCSQRSIHTECIPVTFKDKEKMSAVDERGSAEKMEDNSIDPSASSSPCSFSFRFGKPWSESPFGHWVIIFQKHMVNIYQKLPKVVAGLACHSIFMFFEISPVVINIVYSSISVAGSC